MENRAIAEALNWKLRKENGLYSYYDNSGLLIVYGITESEAVAALPNWWNDDGVALTLTKPNPRLDLTWKILCVPYGFWVEAKFWDTHASEWYAVSMFDFKCAHAICLVALSLSKYMRYMKVDDDE